PGRISVGRRIRTGCDGGVPNSRVTEAITELTAVPLGQRENGSCTSGSYAAFVRPGRLWAPAEMSSTLSSSPKIALTKRSSMALSSCSWPGRAVATTYTGLGHGAAGSARSCPTRTGDQHDPGHGLPRHRRPALRRRTRLARHGPGVRPRPDQA